mmetsp:Transcript_22121/g.52269  ORF Transcript_22121/g.52269 Transcript_22121/m.52269 type:complete len:352 (-) Transcript_22121:83-1138(-)
MKLSTLALLLLNPPLASGEGGIRSAVTSDESDSANVGWPWEKKKDRTSCQCGAGHCDQRACGQGATCGAGHCNQEGLFGPTCGAGHCNQQNTVNPTCGAGNCKQQNSTNPSCGAGHCCQAGATGNISCKAGHCDCQQWYQCIGGSTLLYSCSEEKIIHARDAKIGHRVKTKTDDGEIVCSDVYYLFEHEDTFEDLAVEIMTSSGIDLTVSYDHIVYVGESFEDRREVPSQRVKAGDKLITSTHSSSPTAAVVEAVRVKSVGEAGLVNVLTTNPHLLVFSDESAESGVVISAHAVDHNAYGVLFAPVKYIYWTFGAKAVEYMNPLFKTFDYYSKGKTAELTGYVKWMMAIES